MEGMALRKQCYATCPTPQWACTGDVPGPRPAARSRCNHPSLTAAPVPLQVSNPEVAGAAQAVAVVHRPQVRTAHGWFCCLCTACWLSSAEFRQPHITGGAPTCLLPLLASHPTCIQCNVPSFPPCHAAPHCPTLPDPPLLPSSPPAQPAMAEVERQARMMRAKEEAGRGSYRMPRVNKTMRRQRRIGQARKHN